MEKPKNSGEQPGIANHIGRNVIVGLSYRWDVASEWLPVPKYSPWEGRIVRLPQSDAVNGNVNVMPASPLGEEYPNMHPRLCDVSPHPVPLEDGTLIEIRHTLQPLNESPISSVPPESE